MKRAVILVSGGMDSCVTVASSISDGYCPALLHMNYGQKTEKRELTAFYDIANHYEIKERLVVDISHLSDMCTQGESTNSNGSSSALPADP